MVIIGCGGVGSWLIAALAPFINDAKELTIVDYDKVEAHNLERQTLFTKEDIGKSKVAALAEKYPVTPIDLQVTLDTVSEAFGNEGEVVMLGVDNHFARRCILEFIQVSEWPGMLINGSNEYDTASAWIHKPGIPAVYDRYPELLEAAPPPEIRASCGQLAVSEPQVIHANQMAASLAVWLWRFWTFVAPFMGEGDDDQELKDTYPIEYRAARSRITTIKAGDVHGV